ncbi:IS66 family insertion sequence element accessory protein TnpB [Acidithiobacillus thiooxidans]|uniref:ORFA of ISCARN104, IS66 family n=1 Tax=mine drainage metagenome TaxID=410659 RepID=E6QUX4_9ZZZZ|nr:IS66 family insertion sequence element accessory protein TnpB [Acidithiobacillus thiooxidans]MBU2752944.1 IS66 family insertion sequence element accessory protein TnpB [Acidithiobacillus thiooxidans]
MTKDEKAAYWRRRVDRFLTSGLSVKNYCAQEGIAVGTLHYWRKRFVDAVEMRPMINETEGFLPITLTPVRASVSPVEIHLLSGRSLKLTAPVDPGWLQTLVRVLESPCG